MNLHWLREHLYLLILAICPAALLATSLGVLSTPVHSGSDWMGTLEGSKRLSQFSIPGTHDSCALHEPIAGTAKCQTLTIPEQLAAGVRYLDVRCRHVNDAFVIYHGTICQELSFEDVVSACIEFLNDNPTECIMMSVKEENTPSNTTRSFERTFDSYVTKNPDRWALDGGIPTIDQVKGKIVLLRRFDAVSVPKGIDAEHWIENATFTIESGPTKLRVQDQYVVAKNAEKWTSIQNFYTEASFAGSDFLYLNFTSGYKVGWFGIPDITSVSNFVNPSISKYFTTHEHGRFGVTVMDFADAANCALIIDTNYP
jgi:1-phosphatidylinositol phosphodiesterase